MSDPERRFDVVLPPAIGTEEVEALKDFAARLGGSALEKSREDPITPGLLAELSYEQWGTIAYGKLASAALARRQERAVGRVGIERTSGMVTAYLPHFGIVGNVGRLGPPTMSDDEIDSATLALLNNIRAPFAYAIIPAPTCDNSCPCSLPSNVWQALCKATAFPPMYCGVQSARCSIFIPGSGLKSKGSKGPTGGARFFI